MTQANVKELARSVGWKAAIEYLTEKFLPHHRDHVLTAASNRELSPEEVRYKAGFYDGMKYAYATAVNLGNEDAEEEA